MTSICLQLLTYQTESFIQVRGSPSSSKWLSIVILLSLSCADSKFVTHRVGIPIALSTVGMLWSRLVTNVITYFIINQIIFKLMRFVNVSVMYPQLLFGNIVTLTLALAINLNPNLSPNLNSNTLDSKNP